MAGGDARMILLFLLLAVVIVSTLITYRVSQYEFERGSNAGTAFVVTGFISFIVFVVVQGVSYNHIVTRSYSLPIVSLQDGSEVQGSISGGLFVIRGQIGEKQYFSYYMKSSDGSYRLDKRIAEQSSIWTDATAQTARVDIRDTARSCRPDWYVICDPNADKTWDFSHADFHVPPGSIKESYELDAS